MCGYATVHVRLRNSACAVTRHLARVCALTRQISSFALDIAYFGTSSNVTSRACFLRRWVLIQPAFSKFANIRYFV
jgi:hypothetical protein